MDRLLDLYFNKLPLNYQAMLAAVFMICFAAAFIVQWIGTLTAVVVFFALNQYVHENQKKRTDTPLKQ